jgi:hypothetical protein
MGYYYPQAAVTLRILWEDFNFKSDAALQQVYKLPVLAKQIEVTVNDYNQADTFSLEIDYKSFPFDPRTIRSCGVTIHLENTGEIFKDSNALDILTPTADNTIFQGFADEESISFDDTKRTVKLEGRDLTCLFIDQKYSKGTLPLSERIDKVLRALIDDLKATQPMDLEVRGLEISELPILASFEQSDGDHQLNGRKNIDRDQSYWEVMQDVVARSGLIIFVEIDKVVLTKPRALYSPSSAKVFVYGRNIRNLTMKRKIGRKKNFNVIVRSLDEKNKTVIEAKMPKDGTAEWSKATGIPLGEVKIPELGPKGEQIPQEQWKPAPYISFRVPNIKDRDQLIKTAQEIYEEIGRQQIEGSFETSEMETNTLNANEVFKLIKLRNGTPIQIAINQGDLHGIHDIIVRDRNKQVDEKATIASRAAYLRRRGYDSSVAAALASSMDKFANVFYTKGVKFSLDNDQGFKCTVEFLNFIDTKFSK